MKSLILRILGYVFIVVVVMATVYDFHFVENPEIYSILFFTSTTLALASLIIFLYLHSENSEQKKFEKKKMWKEVKPKNKKKDKKDEISSKPRKENR